VASQPGVIKEAEELILQDWSAKVAAKLVVAFCGLGGGKPVRRVEVIVLQEVIRGSVKLIRTTLRDDVDDRGLAETRRSSVENCRYFLRRLKPAAVAEIVYGPTVRDGTLK
jgi:hypothetical protein